MASRPMNRINHAFLKRIQIRIPIVSKSMGVAVEDDHWKRSKPALKTCCVPLKFVISQSSQYAALSEIAIQSLMTCRCATQFHWCHPDSCGPSRAKLHLADLLDEEDAS